MARRRQIRLCHEGFYYLLVLLAVVIGATIRQLNLLILLGTVLAGPFVFSVIYGRSALRRLRVERQLPKELRADQRLAVDILVTNCRRWLRIWSIAVDDRVEREDDVDVEAAPTKVGVFFPTIGARESQRSVYQGYLPRRGRYRFGPLRVSTRFPLGLVRHSLIIDDAQTLIVHPRISRLTHDWTQVVRQTVSGGQAVQRRGTTEAEYYGMRDWRPGDNRRWIHWRTSARRGSLVVRQFEEHRSRDLALLVDLWQPREPSHQQMDTVETAISFVATLIAEGCRQSGRRLFLSLAASTFLERSGPASPLFFRQQMDELALVAPHHDPGFPAPLVNVLALVPTSIPTLLVSTRAIDWDAAQSAAVEANVQLGGRHLQSVDVSGDDLARYMQD
jgi:uncharacterized protein (DUF58 family)